VKRISKKIVISSVIALVVGFILYALLPWNYGGESLRQFCDGELIGKTSEQVATMARDTGFAVREMEDLVLVTMNGKRHGHTCFFAISDGRVSEARATFIF